MSAPSFSGWVACSPEGQGQISHENHLYLIFFLSKSHYIDDDDGGNDQFDFVNAFSGPGVFFIIPCVDVYEKIDMRSQTFEIPPQEVRSTLSETLFRFSHFYNSSSF